MKSNKQTRPIQPEDILRDHTPLVRQIRGRLREMILDVVPEASQAAYPVWHAIGFRHPLAGYFCGIFPFQDTVKLVFEWGVLLPDPDEVLQGDGKQVRYIEIQNEADTLEPSVRELIAAALALPGDRKMKLWLVHNKASPG